MKTLSIPILLIVAILINACGNKKATNITTNETADSTVTTHTESSSQEKSSADTIKINYANNKDILDLIPLIPDSAMQSWKWSKNERLEFLNTVKNKNHYVDTTPNYNNVLEVLPHYFETQVVDGRFTAACYKASNGSFVLITCDIVGEGKYLCAYLIVQNQVTPLKITDILGPVEKLLLNNADDSMCQSHVEESMPFADYDFTAPGEIKFSLPLTKTEANNCLKGNAAKFIFDPATQKFNLQNINWHK